MKGWTLKKGKNTYICARKICICLPQIGTEVSFHTQLPTSRWLDVSTRQLVLATRRLVPTSPGLFFSNRRFEKTNQGVVTTRRGVVKTNGGSIQNDGSAMESQRKTGKTTERHIGFFTIPICKCEQEKDPNDHGKEIGTGCLWRFHRRVNQPTN